MNDIIIQADNLCFTYEDGTMALKNINTTIRRGEKIALMGSNGSGKTTFSLCLNGILKFQSGTLLIDGQPINYSRKGLLNLRKKIGIVFQDPDTQIFYANVRQEIAFGPLNLGMNQKSVEALVNDTIHQMDMEDFCEKPTHFLSGGQKKQVSIADILVMSPELIVFDEPSASLDPKHTKLVNDIIENLSQRGITVIVITHDADYALAWADRVLVFHHGELLCEQVPQQLFLDKELLTAVHLNQPAVITLHQALCEKHLLGSNMPIPRNLKELTDFIKNVL